MSAKLEAQNSKSLSESREDWRRPDAGAEVSRLVKWVGSLAGGVSCGTIALVGNTLGVVPEQLRLYLLVTALYLALKLAVDSPWAPARWLWRHLWIYLLVMGLFGLALQALSGEPFLQPIVFTVPLVYGALLYSERQVAGIAVGYLVLMNMGIWLGGHPDLMAMAFSTVGYGSLMLFIYAFTRLSVDQAAARRRADQLAGNLASQRDYLMRLAAITATLTRDLELETVLEQVAAAGRALAHAAEARVWLREEQAVDSALALRLAAIVPREHDPAPPEDQAALLGPAPRFNERALILPLIFKGLHVGALELRGSLRGPFSGADVELLQPFADAAVVAIENARLYEQARLSATLAERNRLARELHDTIAQGLTAVTMQLEAAQRSFDRDLARSRTRIARAHELARETLGEVRRSVWTLAAPSVDGQSLREALEDLTRRCAERSGLRVECHPGESAPPLDYMAATQVLRIVQEALQNVEKHAQATCVAVGVEVLPTEIRVWVRDDGVGFVPSDPQAPRPPGDGGFGLVSLRERARLAGGALRIESAPGAGTCVAVSISLDAEG